MKRVVLGIAERHDRKLKRDAHGVAALATSGPESDATTEQPTELPQLSRLTHTGSACTMTNDERTDFSLCNMFFCCTVGNEAATFVSHKAVLDKGSGPDKPAVVDKEVGPAYKEPCFMGYKSVRDDEARLESLSATSFSVFALLLSLLPDVPRRQNELSAENQLLLFLIKLEHNVPFSCLGVLFTVDRKTAARMFTRTLQTLCARTKN
ncbi:unnamed protein product [Ixodes persulcatus]